MPRWRRERQQLRAADAQALDELAGLLEALRAQLLLARYSGSSAEGAGVTVSEVWARLEGLGVAFGEGESAGAGGRATGSTSGEAGDQLR